MEEYRKILMTRRDEVSEDLLNQITADVEAKLPNNLSADVRRREISQRVLEILNTLSLTLSHKMAPVVKFYLSQRSTQPFDSLFAEIGMPEYGPRERAEMFQRMFFKFTGDAACVSYAAPNLKLVGKITLEDLWFLTFFAFVTCRRVRGDNLLQLACTGITSSGKSTLVESPLLGTAHQILTSSSSSSSDTGVGRFSVGSCNVVLLHDVDLGVLLGNDCATIKSLTRSENSVVKVHSSTVTLPELFVFITSNERIQQHRLKALASHSLSSVLQSQLESPGRKRVAEEHVNAIKNRFLELHVHKRPRQDPRDLEANVVFSRDDFIAGTFDRVLHLLAVVYKPDHFHSSCLYRYLLAALEKNALLYENVFNTQNHYLQIQNLLQIYKSA